MVERELTDGPRIATLLAAEIRGRRSGPLGSLAVANEDPDAGTAPPANHRYDVVANDTTVAAVDQQADRIVLDVAVGLEAAREAAVAADLRTRPKATRPPGLLVFVESGTAVKRATDVLAAAVGDRSGERFSSDAADSGT